MMEATAATTAAPVGLGAEAVGLLQRLIRFNTVNPPGNERALQLELEEMLAAAGFDCELPAARPERPNLIARLHGRSAGPTFTLLGHVDTVRADPADWAQDPWSAELAGGEVWGRGALDMKGQVAAEVAAALELARSGWRPATGELALVITADEETGGELGARWLCEEHPDKVRTDFAVNEGGGGFFEHDGRRFYALCVGEKGVFRFKLRARGAAGHASLPRVGDNALLKLAPLVARLSDQPDPEPTPEGLGFLSSVLGEEIGATEVVGALERLRSQQPLLVDYLAEPMMSVTLSPTRAWGSEKANVIPSTAEVLIDCRVPPGLGQRQARERVEALLGPDDYELEFTNEVEGNRSPAHSPLRDAVEGWLAEADHGAELVPTVMPGFSDSNWFRSAFDAATVYGFCPHRRRGLVEATPLIHGADERVPTADVELAAGFFFDLPQRMLG
jgi:acetylornithine deacetylase/succinyl-diaminopimelate desuccinylase-like protein